MMDPLQVEMEQLKRDVESLRDQTDAGVKAGQRRKKKWSKTNFKTKSNQSVSFLLPQTGDEHYNRFLQCTLGQCLPQILVDLSEQEPDDPIHYIAMCLYRALESQRYFRKEKAHLERMNQVQKDLKAEREEATFKQNFLKKFPNYYAKLYIAQLEQERQNEIALIKAVSQVITDSDSMTSIQLQSLRDQLQHATKRIMSIESELIDEKKKKKGSMITLENPFVFSCMMSRWKKCQRNAAKDAPPRPLPVKEEDEQPTVLNLTKVFIPHMNPLDESSSEEDIFCKYDYSSSEVSSTSNIIMGLDKSLRSARPPRPKKEKSQKMKSSASVMSNDGSVASSAQTLMKSSQSLFEGSKALLSGSKTLIDGSMSLIEQSMNFLTTNIETILEGRESLASGTQTISPSKKSESSDTILAPVISKISETKTSNEKSESKRRVSLTRRKSQGSSITKSITEVAETPKVPEIPDTTKDATVITVHDNPEVPEIPDTTKDPTVITVQDNPEVPEIPDTTKDPTVITVQDNPDVLIETTADQEQPTDLPQITSVTTVFHGSPRSPTPYSTSEAEPNDKEHQDGPEEHLFPSIIPPAGKPEAPTLGKSEGPTTTKSEGLPPVRASTSRRISKREEADYHHKKYEKMRITRLISQRIDRGDCEMVEGGIKVPAPKHWKHLGMLKPMVMRGKSRTCNLHTQYPATWIVEEFQPRVMYDPEIYFHRMPHTSNDDTKVMPTSKKQQSITSYIPGNKSLPKPRRSIHPRNQMLSTLSNNDGHSRNSRKGSSASFVKGSSSPRRSIRPHGSIIPSKSVPEALMPSDP